jgi:hypothetical protein
MEAAERQIWRCDTTGMLVTWEDPVKSVFQMINHCLFHHCSASSLLCQGFIHLGVPSYRRSHFSVLVLPNVSSTFSCLYKLIPSLATPSPSKQLSYPSCPLSLQIKQLSATSAFPNCSAHVYTTFAEQEPERESPDEVREPQESPVKVPQ